MKCDRCNEECLVIWFDARIPGYGIWSHLCAVCFVKSFCRLGLGRGQCFSSAHGGKLLG